MEKSWQFKNVCRLSSSDFGKPLAFTLHRSALVYYNGNLPQRRYQVQHFDFLLTSLTNSAHTIFSLYPTEQKDPFMLLQAEQKIQPNQFLKKIRTAGTPSTKQTLHNCTNSNPKDSKRETDCKSPFN